MMPEDPDRARVLELIARRLCLQADAAPSSWEAWTVDAEAILLELESAGFRVVRAALVSELLKRAG